LLVSVATAHAQRNRDLKHAADGHPGRAHAAGLHAPLTGRCDLNGKECEPKNAQELSRACGQLSVTASVTSDANQASIAVAGNTAFGHGEKLRLSVHYP